MNAQREIREARGGPEASCWGKVRFDAGRPDLARQVAARMSKSKHQKITAFRCPHCDGWHVGRQLGNR